jgi:23S rRNA pseudouridine1911/1915/1917 synthase
MQRLPNAEAEAAEVRRIRVRPSSGGRLDAVLAADPGIGLSRTRLKALIEAGAATVNGNVVREPSARVDDGDRIAVELPPAAEPGPRGERIELQIVHEDDDLIVIDKPPGMVVHPAPGHAGGTLVNALIHHCGDSLLGIGGVKRPGIVHRLDMNTSGLMVAAKSERAMASLAAQFADHGKSGVLERAYYAIVWGCPKPKQRIIDAPLGRSGANRLRRAVVGSEAGDAKPAITEYRTLEAYRGRERDETVAALIECRLRTGRTHQIRVHMTHIGHPLIGDREYGGGMKTKAARLADPAATLARNFGRQALHAFLLAFQHPATGETMRFRRAPPADFRRLRDALALQSDISLDPPYANFMLQSHK